MILTFLNRKCPSNISTIFKIYLTQIQIYQRFLKYIDDSTRDIDLPTKFDNITTPYNTTKKTHS
ncbi:hypothetical protein CWB32_11505 [Bacillus cereus]|nr:hypothetical protein [Bacillus cereus]